MFASAERDEASINRSSGFESELLVENASSESEERGMECVEGWRWMEID